MAAYTCVISLLQTLEQIQQRNPYFAKLFDSLHASAQYFQLVLDETSSKTGRFDTQKIKSLEEKIRVAASDAEDAVALEISQILQGVNWKYAIEHSIVLHSRLLPIVERMDALTKHVMKMVSDFDMIRISTSSGEADGDDEILELGDTFISTSNSPMLNLEDNTVQGLDDDLEKIVERLTGPVSHLDIVTITGMGGIGKTTLARKAHDHLAVRDNFDIRVWVTISAEFQSRNVLLDALHCIPNLKKNNYDKKDDDELADLMQKSLKGRRYLFVVDDIWSTDVWDSIRGIFPDNNNRSRILLTTRQTKVAIYASPASPHKMNLLNLDNGWKLLRDKVFGPNHDHPPRLEEIGKEIVKKCQGLPLTITVIAGHLSKTQRTSKSWENVARILGEIIATHPDKCLGVFGLSYHHLPNHLKPCFLYIGGFPEDFQIETWRLIQLWIAEGFVSTSGGPKSLENVAEDYLEDLVSRNLIMVRKRRFNGEIRSCAVHDLLREFCLMEAKVTKFMHAERPHDQVPTLPKQKHNVRRFSFQTNCTVDHCSKRLPRGARSIYIFHQLKPYQHSAKRRIFSLTPPPSILGFPPIFEVFSHFNLLRVLAIRSNKFFYSFPLVITTLFHLRYLEFRCYANLPASIAKLQNLQTLIYDHNRTTAPREIWMMKNLRHIDLGRTCYLPNPESIGNKHLVTGMPNLVQLSTICSSSCTNGVFSGIPNIKILSVGGSLSGEGRNHLYDMSSLTKLEALELSKIAFLRNSIKRFVFPTSLKRLTLGCLFLSWEDISTLVMLPNLEELKLEDRAVSGGLWRLTDEDKFQNLKLLVFSGIYIQWWEASSDNFPNLKRLVLKHCEKLEEIPTDFGEICTLESLELHNCCTRTEDSARAIEQEQKEMGNTSLKVYIHNDDNTSKNCSSGDGFSATSGSSGNSHLSVTARDDTCLNGEILPTPDLKIYSFSDLKLATKNFKSDSVLGIGGFGTVYKGWVDEKTLAPTKAGSGMIVAIKKLHFLSMRGFEEWQWEVNFLGRLSHPNIVKLLGYCQEDEELLLVYEFMLKGSLENHLFAVEPLSWDLRLKIAIGAARGLAFLHASEKKVIHRDFKPSNILLDGSYNAKISDFGFAKLGPSAGNSHVTTRVMGTSGYAAPEYLETGRPYVKSDVYGFGVVLLEILTGLRALDTNRPSGQQLLVDWVKPMLPHKRKMKSIMDARMEGQYSSKAATLAAQITLKCLEDNPNNRPSMKEVMDVLEQIEAIK